MIDYAKQSKAKQIWNENLELNYIQQQRGDQHIVIVLRKVSSEGNETKRNEGDVMLRETNKLRLKDRGTWM